MLRTRTEANKTLNFHHINSFLRGLTRASPPILPGLAVFERHVCVDWRSSDSQEAWVMVKLMYSNLLVAIVPLFLSVDTLNFIVCGCVF